jgi:MHS family proline/betaine transporter-like MFS transporter
MAIAVDSSLIDMGTVPSRRRAVVAATIGNALEWFDLVVYVFLAATISKLFFPVGDETASLLLALATFGVTFFMRPLGAIALGTYADRHGRKAALTLSIVLMTFGTFLIAIAPTHAMVGIAAPLWLLVARLVQGFSAGGEFGSATTFLAEQNRTHRGFHASWQFASQAIAMVVAAVFAFALAASLSPAQMEGWGWRVPFVFGLLIGPVAYYLRTYIDETPEFHARQASASPLRETVTTQVAAVLVGCGLIVVASVAAYTLLFMPTFASRELGLPLDKSLLIAVIAMALQIVLTPVVGALSDRIGRTPPAILASAAFVLVSQPLFAWLVAAPSLQTLAVVQLVFSALISAYVGSLPALMSELFPTRTRTTGVAIAYSLGVTIFGGFAPFVIAWLIAATGSKVAPSYYLMLAAFVSLAALMAARRLGAR